MGCKLLTLFQTGSRLSFRRLAASTAMLSVLCGVVPAFAASGSGAYLAGRHATILNDADAAATYFTRALAADPKRVELMEQSVLFKVAAGRIKDALPVARILVAENPRQRVAQLVLLVDEMRRGDHDAVMQRLDEHGDTAFNAVTRRLVAGWAGYGEDDLDLALKEFDALDGQELYRVFARYHAALAASAAGKADEAEKRFTAAIGENAPSVRLAEAYGRFLEAEDRGEDAVALYERTLERAPGDPILEQALLRAAKTDDKPALLVNTSVEGASEALYGLASAFARDEGGVRLSLVYAQLALHLNTGNEAARLLLGNLFEAQERWVEAADTYEAFTDESAYYRHAQVGRAEAFSRVDRIDDAFSALSDLQEAFPADVTVPIAIGDLLRRSERYAEARDAYDRAIELVNEEDEPRYWSLFYARGVCNERVGDWDAAQDDLLKALEFRPDQAHVLNYLGYSWIEQGRNLQPAREMIERAVELRPNDGYITDSLGWVQYRLGEFEAAVKTMERAVELVPTDPVINDHFGDTLWMVGRKLEARFQWRRALSFEPEDQAEVARIKRKLDEGLDVVLAEEREAMPEDSEGVAVNGDKEPEPKDAKTDG